MKTRISILTLSIFGACAAHAELKWDQTTIELHPNIGDKQAVAHFKYQNAGTAAVHFKSVKASCGCTTTQSQREVVNPGEKGEITATFNIGDRTGTQMKTVTVQTDDPNPTQATTILTLKANIPQALEIKPTFVYWQNGEAPKPKKISIKASKDFPAKNISVKSSNQAFESKVTPGSAPGEWTIEVTPKDTSHAAGTSLLVQTDYPKDAPKSFYVNAQVTIPPAPAASLPVTGANRPAGTPAVAGTPPARPTLPPTPAQP
jgi:Protein of unknown function (DUF1573)